MKTQLEIEDIQAIASAVIEDNENQERRQ